MALVYSGEGATSTGAFHEGLNFAAVQRVPLVVVVEENGYAYSTPTRRQYCAILHCEHMGLIGLQRFWP